MTPLGLVDLAGTPAVQEAMSDALRSSRCRRLLGDAERLLEVVELAVLGILSLLPLG